MKVAEINSGWGLHNLQVVRREVPDPVGDEVVVRLRAASVNYRDWLMLQGKYNPRQPLPLVPASDGAGVVQAVGPEVTRFAVGDRVMPAFFRDWISGRPRTEVLRTALGGPLDGTLREYICLPQHAFVSTPHHLTDIEAATLPCAALTAWSALVAQGGLRAGDCVLVLGTGGVATFAMQIAQMCGARVVATTSSEEKMEILRGRFGVRDVVNYRDEPQWGQVVREMTGGGVDHVIEVGGAGTLAQSIRAVRPGGTISLIGVLAGGASQVNLTPVLMQNIRVQGVIVGPRDELEAMNRAFELHELRPVVDRTFALDDVRAAFEHLTEQRHIGKVVVEL